MVGFFDLEDKSGVPKVMPHFFTKEIYKLQLAPIKDESYALSTTSEGKLVYWNIETTQAGKKLLIAHFPETR
ncbi:unnamed protein product [Callosobruchus maculatus]|uniref:Uncharacterized protein n=1 Tax=Callosobruchus maculatus TaxID=64391 RepID=A0A653DLR2_CALMS|nr:unnamed protein product [Callosobruchus maculatus]VEN62288.1 unnamed protein product [Callosobruchus maculatus]